MLLISLGGITACSTPSAVDVVTYDDAVRCYGVAHSLKVSGRDIGTGGSDRQWFDRAKQLGAKAGISGEQVAGNLGRSAGDGMIALPYPSDKDQPDAANELSKKASKCAQLGKSFATIEEARI